MVARSTVLLPSILALVAISAAPLPYRVDNRATPYFPSVISQVGESCGSANGTGYIFNYEINAARGTSVADSGNKYPYFGTYNFLNNGSENNGTYRMFINAWEIIRDNGIPNAVDFGPVKTGSTQWLNGYDKYYRAMRNRVQSIDSVSFLAAGGLTAMKQWLFDHGNGAPAGGIFTFTVSVWGVQDAQIAVGPDKGKFIIRRFGTDPASGPHALAVVGYNDSIRFDFNGDGKITNSIDINADGSVNRKDDEFGAFICANTWGLSSGDSGFIYAPYRLFVSAFNDGGLITNTAYTITVRHDFRPLRTFRAAITHAKRNALALSVGIAADSAASAPSHVRPLKQFAHAGGALPMCGDKSSPAIELGLDATDLIDSLPDRSAAAAWFLIVDADDNAGTFNALSLMDYSGPTPVEYSFSALPATINKGKNIYRIAAPPLAMKNERKTADYHPSEVAVRRIGYTLQLLIPPGVERYEMFGIDGKTIVASGINRLEGWYTLPAVPAPGSYVVRFYRRDGEQHFSRVIVIYP